MSDAKDGSPSEEELEFSRQGVFYHILLGALLLLMGLQPLADVGGGVFVQLASAILLLAGIAAMAKRRLYLIGLVLGLPAIGLLFLPGPIPTVTGRSLTIATLLFICLVILRRISRHPVVTSATVSASLVVYLAFGVIWSEAYSLLEHLRPGSFTGLSGAGDLVVHRDLFYYSYVTLATLGYGDINPLHPVARSLAITEAIVGQLYLVVLVAGLVAMSFSQRQSRTDQ